MGMALPKVIASVVSANNENTLALVNVSFEFSLFKVPAPEEFNPLGLAISKSRRQEAEEGIHHQTARKLGALFQSMLPSAPELFKAYGTRASEISGFSGINPKGSSEDGMFANFVGLDATSIWAAATSGPSAIAVHLLACIIARMFTTSEATSIWVEVVQQRQQQLRQAIAEGQFDHYSGVLTTPELITRPHLANWDASARSWLQSADEAKSPEQRKLMLALERVKIPIVNENSVLDSVVKTWTSALKVMDSIVKGVAQRVQDGVVLLGLSSWHLYPDMHLLGETIAFIKQHDSLVAPGGLLTFGLQLSPDFDDSISWSMPLAYLRYYGDPVMSRGSLPTQDSRITPGELAIVALGCILRDWADDQTTTEDMAALFPAAYQALERAAEEHQGRLQIPFLPHFLRWPSWIVLLSNAATTLLESQGRDRDRFHQLLRLGRRRPQFLGNGHKIPKAFGLCSHSQLIGIIQRPEDRISVIRKYADDNGLSPTRCLIYCRIHPKSAELSSYVVYASVAPVIRRAPNPSNKRSSDGSMTGEKLCASWIEGDAAAADYAIPEEMHFRLDVPLASEFVIETLIEFSGSIKIIRLQNGLINGQGTIEKWGLIPERLGIIPRLFTVKEITKVLSTTPLVLQRLLDSISRLNPLFREAWRVYNLSPYEERSPSYHPESVAVVNGFRECQRSLLALEVIAELYRLMPGATISTALTSRTLGLAWWVERYFYRWLGDVLFNGTRINFHLTRSMAFACVAHCQSGSCDLEPSILEKAFALSVGNSIFVAGGLLCDPAERPSQMEIRRLIGNVGRAGLLFLVPPHDPKIRPVDEENWRLINHDPFDGKLEDSFSHTTMHLSFTDFVMPLSVESVGDRDSDAYLIESVVSVHHQGRWVADLDILPVFDPGPAFPKVIATSRECDKLHGDFKPIRATMVDTWEEFLEFPDSIFIVRAHRNWMARLAFAAISRKRGHLIEILPEDPCWGCFGHLTQNFCYDRFYTDTHSCSTNQEYCVVEPIWELGWEQRVVFIA